jgi:pyridine nucleotide-disulfide oxidoreductase family protein
MQSSPPQRDLVLVGIGHTNAHVLRLWRTQPLPNVRLTCVSDHRQATYSGMLPGTLAGLYPPDRMQIDLERLCAVASAGLICSEVTGLDLHSRQLHFADRPSLPFDLLSIGIGSIPAGRDALPVDAAIVPIKPMQTFVERLDLRLADLARGEQADAPPTAAGVARPLRAVVVGGGVAGLEIALCLPARLAAKTPGQAWRLTIIDRGAELAPGLSRWARRLARRELARRGVDVFLGREVEPVGNGQLRLSERHDLQADLILWATGAQAPPLLGQLGLPTDGRGFLLVRPTLQTVGSDLVFAVGDSGSMANSPTPKAGVFAVRQGPILWRNLQAAFAGRPLSDYRPQRDFLRLVATGDGRAILDYRGLALHARWCWRQKDRIDGRFIDLFHDAAIAD